jgi:hypothetical protein
LRRLNPAILPNRDWFLRAPNSVTSRLRYAYHDGPSGSSSDSRSEGFAGSLKRVDGINRDLELVSRSQLCEIRQLLAVSNDVDV